MCGIAGFICPRASANGLTLLHDMTRSLSHRGPDSEGFWQSRDGRVNLGHRRLAIIDLSPNGHQPMATADGRFVLSFNGEIYNFLDIREELEQAGQTFRSSGDTEVLLYALARWGVESTLRKLNGMFAFALWDSAEKRLWLARDRFGEKPLYYGSQNGLFIFGSEMRVFEKHPDFRREVDPDILPSFLRFNYIPWPYSIFKGIRKLEPAHYLAIGPDGALRESKPYWRLYDLLNEETEHSIDIRDQDVINHLERIMLKAVRQRMLSDVPLGAFLSGGIDSSTIVALMQAQSSRPIKTFTIGFWDPNYNEAEDAAKIAHHLGTDHHEHYLSSRECFDLIERLPQIYDEPFADSSQIPTTLVSQFTRRHVTVALSGDAGDELFGGYNRYVWGQRLWPLMRALPNSVCKFGRELVHGLEPDTWNQLFQTIDPFLPRRLRLRGGGEKLHKFAQALGAQDPDELYRIFVSQWQEPRRIALGAKELRSLIEDPESCPKGLDFVERMMFLDQMTYLPSDILTKVDRASMSTNLEARVPFLDNDVVHFAWSLPLSVKIRNKIGKWPLRQLLKRYIPENLFERPKAGFGVPVGDWMRGPLRDWAEELLSEKRLSDGGYFDVKRVRAEWADHLAGRRKAQYRLWSILMFEGWRQWNRS